MSILPKFLTLKWNISRTIWRIDGSFFFIFHALSFEPNFSFDRRFPLIMYHMSQDIFMLKLILFRRYYCNLKNWGLFETNQVVFLPPVTKCELSVATTRTTYNRKYENKMCIKMLSFSTYLQTNKKIFYLKFQFFYLSKTGSRVNWQSIYYLGFSKRDQTVFTTPNKVFSWILLKFLVFDICLIFARNSLILL